MEYWLLNTATAQSEGVYTDRDEALYGLHTRLLADPAAPVALLLCTVRYTPVSALYPRLPVSVGDCFTEDPEAFAIWLDRQVLQSRIRAFGGPKVTAAIAQFQLNRHLYRPGPRFSPAAGDWEALLSWCQQELSATISVAPVRWGNSEDSPVPTLAGIEAFLRDLNRGAL